MVQRVVYNSCFGGFGVKNDVVRWVRENRSRLEEEYDDTEVEQLAERTLPGEMYPDGSGPRDERSDYIGDLYIDRDNELLAHIVSGQSEYTGRVNGRHSSLYVAEVPDDVKWTIDRYDGRERVEEKSRTFS